VISSYKREEEYLSLHTQYMVWITHRDIVGHVSFMVVSGGVIPQALNHSPQIMYKSKVWGMINHEDKELRDRENESL
jgi:hypothetical protein